MEQPDAGGAVAPGAILLEDHQLGRNPFGGPPGNVSRGELLVPVQLKDRTIQKDHHHNYMLRSEPERTCLLDETEVALLNSEEFLLLEAIGMPYRLETFNSNKLEWATTLKAGTDISIRMEGTNIINPHYARAVIRYKGILEGQKGLYFGVEILVSYSYIRKNSSDCQL